MRERKEVQFSVATVMALLLFATLVLTLFRGVDAHTAGVLAVLAVIILCTVPSSLIGLFFLIRRLLRRLMSLTLRRCDAKSGPLGEAY
jgi:hypothetical protein